MISSILITEKIYRDFKDDTDIHNIVNSIRTLKLQVNQITNSNLNNQEINNSNEI